MHLSELAFTQADSSIVSFATAHVPAAGGCSSAKAVSPASYMGGITALMDGRGWAFETQPNGVSAMRTKTADWGELWTDATVAESGRREI